jgi:hypothetical protein
MTSPAAADMSEPVKIASPVSSTPSYHFFEARSHGSAPGAYWNPCRTITYGIDFRTATRHGINKAWEQQRWASAISEISAASGLHFRYVGEIATRPAGRQPARVSGVDIVVTFGTQRHYRAALRGANVGEAGVNWRSVGARHQITKGYVVIDAEDVVSQTTAWQVPPDTRPAGERPPDLLRALYMHEFGHAVGLEHVQDKGQLMFPTISPSRPDVLGSGDLEGLRKLGSQRCF